MKYLLLSLFLSFSSSFAVKAQTLLIHDMRTPVTITLPFQDWLYMQSQLDTLGLALKDTILNVDLKSAQHFMNRAYAIPFELKYKIQVQLYLAIYAKPAADTTATKKGTKPK